MHCQVQSWCAACAATVMTSVARLHCTQAVSAKFYYRFKEAGNTVDWMSLVISVRGEKCETCSICNMGSTKPPRLQSLLSQRLPGGLAALHIGRHLPAVPRQSGSCSLSWCVLCCRASIASS